MACGQSHTHMARFRKEEYQSKLLIKLRPSFRGRTFPPLLPADASGGWQMGHLYFGRWFWSPSLILSFFFLLAYCISWTLRGWDIVKEEVIKLKVRATVFLLQPHPWWDPKHSLAKGIVVTDSLLLLYFLPFLPAWSEGEGLSFFSILWLFCSGTQLWQGTSVAVKIQIH